MYNMCIGIYDIKYSDAINISVPRNNLLLRL